MKKFLREVKRINWTQTFFSSKKRTGVTMLITIPALIGATSLGYQYYLQNNPAVVYAHKLQTMTQQVGKSLALPKDEKPTVATVTDTNILPKEEFFAYAQNGDKILMYKKHKLAILYRPSTGLVITKANLVFRDTMPTPSNPSTGSGTSSVAGASTSANPAQDTAAPGVSSSPQPTVPYHPQGKILVQPQQ